MTEGRARGRPRRPETDERLLQAALELMREKGPAGVTFEAVAARSGVARTTIYRRFESRSQLVESVIDSLVDQPLPPPELSLEAKLRWVLEQVEELVEHGLGPGAVATLLTDSDPHFTVALRRALERRLAAIRAQVEDDIQAGQVAEGTDPDALVGLLLGAYLGEVVRHHRPPAGWVDATTALLLRAIQPVPRRGRRG